MKQAQTEGWQIVAIGVGVRILGYDDIRFYDYLKLDPVSGQILGVEVKTSIINRIPFVDSQVNFDAALVSSASGGLSTTGLVVQGVTYQAYGFAAEMTDFRTSVLENILRSHGIPIEKTLMPGVYYRKP